MDPSKGVQLLNLMPVCLLQIGGDRMGAKEGRLYFFAARETRFQDRIIRIYGGKYPILYFDFRQFGKNQFIGRNKNPAFYGLNAGDFHPRFTQTAESEFGKGVNGGLIFGRQRLRWITDIHRAAFICSEGNQYCPNAGLTPAQQEP